MLGYIRQGELLKTESGCYDDYSKEYWDVLLNADLDALMKEFIETDDMVKSYFCAGRFMYMLVKKGIVRSMDEQYDSVIYFGNYPDIGTVTTGMGKYNAV